MPTIFNNDANASEKRPREVSVNISQSGFNGTNIFLNKKEGLKLANSLRESSTPYQDLASDGVGIGLGVIYSPLGTLYTAAEIDQSFLNYYNSKDIKHILKYHSGVVLESVAPDADQPGGSHIGSWNGYLSSAKSHAKAGGWSIDKIRVLK